MELEHTPGPWFTKRHGFSTVYVEARLRDGWLQEVAACGPTEAGQEQQEANARLIAAAPDLLEALYALLPDAVGNHIGGPDTQARIDAARAAIAKATGSAA